MYCPSCSSQLPDDACFCAFCGDKVPRCHSCQNLSPGDGHFCVHCGARQDAPQRAPKDRATRQVAPIAPREPDTEPVIGFQPPEDIPPQIYGFLYLPSDPETFFRLLDGDNTIGAGSNNDIIVDQPAISWNHAVFICRNGKILIQDSASTNGTFVNGERIRRPTQVRHGNVLRLGNVDLELWLVDARRT